MKKGLKKGKKEDLEKKRLEDFKKKLQEEMEADERFFRKISKGCPEKPVKPKDILQAFDRLALAFGYHPHLVMTHPKVLARVGLDRELVTEELYKMAVERTHEEAAKHSERTNAKPDKSHGSFLCDIIEWCRSDFPKVEEPERDYLGFKNGTRTSNFNLALSGLPRSFQQLVDKSENQDFSLKMRDHLKLLREKGFVIRQSGKYKLTKKALKMRRDHA